MLVPSDMISSGDNLVGYASGMVTDSGFAMILRSESNMMNDSHMTEAERAAAGKRGIQRHNGRGNVGFCDGHVENLPFKPLFLDKNDAALSRWNIDHEPHRK